MNTLTKQDKKIIVKLYKKVMKREVKEPIRHSQILLHHFDRDIDCRRDVWLINAETEEEVRSLFRSLFIGIDGIEAVPSLYDCTGQPFGPPATISKLCDNRFIVRRLIHFDL